MRTRCTRALPLRHPTVLPRGWDGPHSSKHLPTHTQRGQESGSPSTLGISRLLGEADGGTQICQPRGEGCTALTWHGGTRLAPEGHTHTSHPTTHPGAGESGGQERAAA